MMLAQRTDLSFDRDASVRLIPFIVALMVYLAVLALAGSLVLQRGMRHWGEGLTGTMTVQVPQPDQPNAALQSTRVEKVIQVLKALPDVEQARVIPEKEIAALLQPWLGSGGLVRDLPLPTLIDVKLKTGRLSDADQARQLLVAAIPGTLLDDHDEWRQKLGRLAQAVAMIGFAILGLIAAASVLIVVFSTRAGLLVHKDSIEILHMIGAHDRYIARQFQTRALRLGSYGAGVGAALSLFTLAIIGYLGNGIEDQLLPRFHLAVIDWVLIIAMPLLAILLTTVTARLTVMRVLRQMI